MTATIAWPYPLRPPLGTAVRLGSVKVGSVVDVVTDLRGVSHIEIQMVEDIAELGAANAVSIEVEDS